MSESPRPYSDQHDRCWQLSGKSPPGCLNRKIAAVTVITFCVWLLTADLRANLVDLLDTRAIFLVYCFGSLALTVVGELYCVLLTTHRITTLINSSHWDLVRLTPIQPEKYCADLYVSMQLRCWKVITVETIVRLIPLEVIAVEIFTLVISSKDTNSFLFGLIVAIALWAGLALLSFIIFIESRWRFEAIIATSLAVSVKSRNHFFAMMMESAAVGLMHCVTLLMLFAPFLEQFIPFQYMKLGRDSVQLLSILSLMALVFLFEFYKFTCNRALIFAQRELFRPE